MPKRFRPSYGTVWSRILGCNSRPLSGDEDAERASSSISAARTYYQYAACEYGLEESRDVIIARLPYLFHMTPQYDRALQDVVEGVSAWSTWGRMGWSDVRARYRRTTFGPFWATVSLGIFMVSFSIVWAQLW